MNRRATRGIVIAALLVAAILTAGFLAGADLPDIHAMTVRGY